MLNKIQIFKNYEEFLIREDRYVNGVTQDFLTKNNLTLETLCLVNCKGCWNCIDCENCENCTECIHCTDCLDCASCIGCTGSIAEVAKPNRFLNLN